MTISRSPYHRTMADTTNPPGRQPDFNLMNQGFRTAFAEIERLPNLPAIAGADRILAVVERISVGLEQVRQELREMRQETREQFVHLEQNLRSAISTSDLNNAARVQNTYLITHLDAISPFLNPLTGAEIPGFPATPAEIGRMPQNEINAVLQQLGVRAPTGNLAMKRRQLRTHIGLTPQLGP